jgi:hypothetical protein
MLSIPLYRRAIHELGLLRLHEIDACKGHLLGDSIGTEFRNGQMVAGDTLHLLAKPSDVISWVSTGIDLSLRRTECFPQSTNAFPRPKSRLLLAKLVQRVWSSLSLKLHKRRSEPARPDVPGDQRPVLQTASPE